MPVTIEVPISAGLIFATRTAMAAYVTQDQDSVANGFQNLFTRIAPLIKEKIQTGELKAKDLFYLSVLPESPFVLEYNVPDPRQTTTYPRAGYWVHRTTGGCAYHLGFVDESADDGEIHRQSALSAAIGHFFGASDE